MKTFSLALSLFALLLGACTWQPHATGPVHTPHTNPKARNYEWQNMERQPVSPGAAATVRNPHR